MTAKPLTVVAVSGSLHEPSKTTVLLKSILAALGERIPVETHLIALTDIGPDLAGALERSQVPERVERELQRIEQADLLVVASPVYRASFTGLFKHLFDFVDQYALVDKPVLLAASGGSERHALIIEHQLRPLFAFFQALALPIGVYAMDADFTDYVISAPLLTERIEKAVTRALPVIKANIAERDDLARRLAGDADPLSAPLTPAPDDTPIRLYS